MAKTIRLIDSTFTPGEAEKITTVSTDLQRDWRRRGIIPHEGNGWTKHTPVALARLMFLAALSKIGRDPARHLEYVEGAESYAARVLFFALGYPGAIENTSDERITAEDIVKFSGERGDIAHRFFVLGMNGQQALVTDANIPFNHKEMEMLAASIIDLKRLGVFMAHAVDRPLIAVAVEGEETDEDRAAYAARLKLMPMLDVKARRARGEAELAKLAKAMKTVKPKGKKK